MKLDHRWLAALVALAAASLSTACSTTTNVFVSESAANEGDRPATYATQSGSLEAGTVPACDYTMSFGQFFIEKDVNNLVQSVSGYAQLGAHGSAGEEYAIYRGAVRVAPTLGEVEAIYNGAPARVLLSALTSLELPAAEFDLVGPDLDTTPQRTVIIRHTDHGVSSYQLLLVTFVP